MLRQSEPIQNNLTERTVKNERFIQAVDYLIQTKRVKDAKELCERTKITESTISNVRKNKKGISNKTVYKLLDAFPGIFIVDYFMCKPTHMLVEDFVYYRQHPEEDVYSRAYVPYSLREEKTRQVAEPMGEYHAAVPAWADTMMSIMAEQIKQNEALNRELHQSLSQVATLKQQLTELLQTLKAETPMKHPKS